MDDTLTVILIIVIFLIIVFVVYKLTRINNRRYVTNHDNVKKCHDNERNALNEIKRMQSKNIEGSERMNAYYSKSRQCWLVGKSSWV